MKTNSLVSVIMPVYNAGSYLRSSVKSILAQTYTNLEILIIDDGSTDGCIDSVSDLQDSRVRIISQQNSGKPASVNYALDVIQGEFYLIQDADDISHPERIASLVSCMNANPELAAVFSGHEMIIKGKHIAPHFSGKSIEQCHEDIKHFRMPALDPTGMYRVSAVRGFRFDPQLRICEGLDYILQIGEKYPMVVLDKCLYSYRVHFASITREKGLQKHLALNKVIEKACIRRGLNPEHHLKSPRQVPKIFSHRLRESDVVPHFMESVLDLCCSGQNIQGLKVVISCLRLHIWDPFYYKPLVYWLAPMWLVEYYRAIKSLAKQS